MNILNVKIINVKYRIFYGNEMSRSKLIGYCTISKFVVNSYSRLHVAKMLNIWGIFK